MTKEKIAHDAYRMLKYFYDNKILIHFKDFDDIFFNGEIIQLDEVTLTMILKERVKGTILIKLEDVNPDTIIKFKDNAERRTQDK